MPEARIGISGWRYVPWRGTFYPKGLPQKRELEFASRCLNSIEINGTFYSLQRPNNFAEWYAQTPDGFVFSVKGGRFITHMMNAAWQIFERPPAQESPSAALRTPPPLARAFVVTEGTVACRAKLAALSEVRATVQRITKHFVAIVVRPSAKRIPQPRLPAPTTFLGCGGKIGEQREHVDQNDSKAAP